MHSMILASSACKDVARSYLTKSDEYYKKFQKLPSPQIIHDDLSRLISEESRSCTDISSNATNDERTDKILIIGDVHGCLDELKLLVKKATNDYNNGKQFVSTVFVGDLCNKGPYSSEVIRYVRKRPYWYSIRGNHDNAALTAALGDADRLANEKYTWVKDLSDEDVEWMAELPYTIRISKDMISHHSKEDILLVHAGFIPNIPVNKQDIKTMVTVRNVTLIQNNNENGDGISNSQKNQFKDYNSAEEDEDPICVAKAWTGPEIILFGHDAKRGVQLEKHAIGLDSGCVYGNKLTGIVLPEKELVSVDAAKMYCPIDDKKNRPIVDRS